MVAKSIGDQFTPSVPWPGSGTPMLNAMASAGTARTAAVTSTHRPHRIRLFVSMSCVMFSLMICADVSANVPNTKPCRPPFALVRSRQRSVKVCAIGSPKRSWKGRG